MNKNIKFIIIALCIALLSGCSKPAVLKTKDMLELCSFEQNSDVAKIEKGKVAKTLSKEKVKQGKYSLKCDFPVGGGAVSFYGTLSKNWFGYKYLKFDVYSDDDVALSLFVADKQNKKYKDRYNKERIMLKEGWNKVEIPLSDIGKKISLDGIMHLNIFLWKTEQKNTLYFDNLRLANDEVDNNQTSANIKVYINPAVEKGKISPLLYGSNLCPKMESDQKIIDFVKSVGLTCFRYPGGGSPGWHWKTGKADFDKGVENMPLGKIDYLIQFCKQTNTKLIMQVNIESGTPQEAAELVEYMNKTTNFRVDYWELGNEVYGDWDKAYTNVGQYAQLVKDYSKAMKAVDSTVKIGADWSGNSKWDETIIRESGDYIDFVSYHWYPSHTNKTHQWEGRTHPLAEEVMANAMAIPSIVKRFDKIIEKYASNRKGKIEMTFLEWDGAWDAPSSDPNPPYAQGIMQWSLANAIFYADILGKFAENGVTASTHYSLQECMFGLIRGWDEAAGWGGVKWDGEIIRPKAFAIELYSKHFGDTLIETKLENSPYYNKKEDWWPDSHTGQVPYITCYASKFNGNKKLGIILINKHSYNDYDIEIAIDGKANNTGKTWVLNGPALIAQNDGQPGSVSIKEFNLTNLNNNFKYKLPAHSVVAMEIEIL